jgi:general nucleoside transport system permease protein
MPQPPPLPSRNLITGWRQMTRSFYPFPWVLEPRPLPKRRFVYLAPLLALFLTMLCGALLFHSLGFAPLPTLYAYFITPIASLNGISELLVKAAPLMLCAAGLAVGFRANVWNIGAEGQFILGAIGAGGAALFLPLPENAFGLILCLAIGMVTGALWAGLAAWLRIYAHVSEILSSLMLSYVASLVLSYLVHGPWRDPEGFNFPQSAVFASAFTLPTLAGTRLHPGILVAVFVLCLSWLILARTMIGFRLTVLGLAPQAARYAGFSAKGGIWLSLLWGGALSGLAGAFEVTGPIGQLVPNISPGYGFTAIIVAFLGRLHPLGIMAAALIVALSYLGGESAQIALNLPLAASGVFQGALLFFLLACDVFVRYRLRRRR